MEVLQLICMLILKLFICAHYVIMLHLISIVYVLLIPFIHFHLLNSIYSKFNSIGSTSFISPFQLNPFHLDSDIS